MQRYVLLLVAGCLLSVSVVSSASAQSPANKDAIFVFDVDPIRLRESGMIQQTEGLAKNAMASTSPAGKIELSELRRIQGAMSAPADLESVRSMKAKETLPFEMFIQVQFKTAGLADEAYQQAKSRGVPTTIDGKQFFAVPPNKGGPTNMLVHRYSQDIIELGTKKYLMSPDRDFLTNNLADAWPKIPNAAIRLGLDLDGVRHLIDYSSMSNGVVAHPAILIVEETSVVRLGADFTGDTMLWLSLRTEEAEAAQRIETVFDSILATFKNIGTQTLSQAGPDMQVPGQAVLNAMDAKVEGNDVNVVLPNPPGLMEAIGKAFPSLGIAN